MIEKTTLNEVLAYTNCTELPKPLKKNDIYVRAIALVRKMDNRESYCVVENDGQGGAVIKKTFGSMSVIADIEKIYPLSILSKSAIPDFRKKEDIIEFLVRCGEDREKITNLMSEGTDESKQEAKNLVVAHCIARQKAYEKNQTYKSKAMVEPKPEKSNNNNNDKNENDNDKGNETKEPTGETGGQKEPADNEQQGE